MEKQYFRFFMIFLLLLVIYVLQARCKYLPKRTMPILYCLALESLMAMTSLKSMLQQILHYLTSGYYIHQCVHIARSTCTNSSHIFSYPPFISVILKVCSTWLSHRLLSIMGLLSKFQPLNFIPYPFFLFLHGVK